MKTHQVNGDTSAPYGSASRAPLPGEAERLSGTVVSVSQPKPQPGKASPKNEPAFAPPQQNPAVPRDEFHGRGGTYALVDGKRVPADEHGNPLPAKK